MGFNAATFSAIAGLTLAGSIAAASEAVSNDAIAGQRAALATATQGAGFGPQSPRDIDDPAGTNSRIFGTAPHYSLMNLCNIHFHESAEHKGGEFTIYAGNGDGEGYGSGYMYSGSLSNAEMAPIDMKVGATEHGDLVPGDTIEIHFVHSSAQVEPGPTLGACVTDDIGNPALRVETVVGVLVSEGGEDFIKMSALNVVNGYHQAVGLPNNLGDPVQYAGSTTGPGYNEKGSPYHVTWNVRPNVVKIDIASVGAWLRDNRFNEDHAHGVRNLVINSDLLSAIK